MTTDRNSEWLLVPREPTRSMMRGGASRWIEASEEALTIEGELQAARGAWAAMLAVAPTPPTSIPAAEVQALVERMDRALLEGDPNTKPTTRHWRDELAKLIPRGK